MNPTPKKTIKHQTISLSHPLHPAVPTWHGNPADYTLTITVDYKDCATRTKFRAQKISMATGLGTHIDAPAHCIPGGKTIDQIDQHRLIAPLIVIDVSPKATKSYRIAQEDILEFEAKHGFLPQHSLICFYTGWSQLWKQPAAYQHFPGLSADAATLLVERNPYGIGIDTHSVDILEGDYFPAHEIILGHGCYIVENMNNLERIPATGATAIVAPLIIADATESPAHIIAIMSTITL